MIRLHIPKHFENLGVMKTMKQILEVYIQTTEEAENDFRYLDYNKSSSIDPVLRLLEFLTDFPEDKEERTRIENILRYYSHRLYSLRGTLRVFDVLKELEDEINFRIGSYKYNTNELEIDIDTISLRDLELFKIYLSGFFGSLLYYKDIKELVHEVTLEIELVSNPKLTGGAAFITEFIV